MLVNDQYISMQGTNLNAPSIGIYILKDEVYLMFLEDTKDLILKAQATEVDFTKVHFEYQWLHRIYTSRDMSKSQIGRDQVLQHYRIELLTREIRRLAGDTNSGNNGYIQEMT